ncbi:hypothetical protein [Photobacterium lipolyticum]|uniref:Uncharacterized protein n=1 Tax=Photobacterium lipolyticum TaxID=266810 RepID=A0A2T3MWI2_9GAMM|nr:hypothetical protein [Photobacterium lipolyticum]PSW04345.1 hypothetical protein C9I89_13550 [Photobacterium lipolyticum]
MIRENTFAPSNVWTKPFVSEVAEILNLLREYGYDSATLVKITAIPERKFRDWSARYKKEPFEISTIPYACWCFLAALVGRPNIQNHGRPLPADIRKILGTFNASAFRPANKFVTPSADQLREIVGDNAFTGLTISDLSASFDWNSTHFNDNLEKSNIPFLNWCLILMLLGLDIQKMILTDLDGELTIN